MKLHVRDLFKSIVTVLLLCSLLLVTTGAVVAQGDVSELLPDTGEKPSSVPYILMGVMALCVIVIVVLFWPKKKRQDKESTTEESEDQQ